MAKVPDYDKDDEGKDDSAKKQPGTASRTLEHDSFEQRLDLAGSFDYPLYLDTLNATSSHLDVAVVSADPPLDPLLFESRCTVCFVATRA
jgi:hypothetical protein